MMPAHSIMETERTFCMIKPDGVMRAKIGEIISRFEKVGLKLIGLKIVQLSKEKAEKHYDIHKGKPFYNRLVKFVTSGPVVCMVLEGNEAIRRVRKLVGATKPIESDVGTIRGDLAHRMEHNIIHASDSPKTAKKEIKIFFTKKELIKYDLPHQEWL